MRERVPVAQFVESGAGLGGGGASRAGLTGIQRTEAVVAGEELAGRGFVGWGREWRVVGCQGGERPSQLSM